MKLTLAVFLLATVTSAFAKMDFISVHSQINGNDEDTVVLKLADGRTAFWNTKEISNITPEQLKSHKGMIQLDMSDEQDVLSLNLVSGFVNDVRPSTNLSSSLNDAPYKPTILANYKTAQDVMAGFNLQIAEDAQCYDKAHRWVFDEYMSYQTKLMKVFLFFSDSYITRYKFKWWFHAAPFAYLRMNNETTERVLDPTFSQYPLKFKLWTDIFMKNKVECKTITKYSDYVNDLNTDCFLHRASMYFWQPKDLDSFERTGQQKTAFIDWEIDWAYEHGFGIKRPQ